MTDRIDAAEYRRIAAAADRPRAFLKFDQFLQFRGFGRLERELRFHPERMFRFDWAFPDLRIAFEYDGLTAPTMRQAAGGESNAGHASVRGILRDSEKINHAQLLGWQVYRVNAKSIGDGSAYTIAAAALERAAGKRGDDAIETEIKRDAV